MAMFSVLGGQPTLPGIAAAPRDLTMWRDANSSPPISPFIRSG
jgi:hypothetical protein